MNDPLFVERVNALFLNLLSHGKRGILSRMSFQVAFQAYVICETQVTLNTLVRLLSSVNSDVSLKASFNREALSTLRAGERLLSSVNIHVSHQMKI